MFSSNFPDTNPKEVRSNKKTARVADLSHRVQSTEWGSDTRAVLFLSFTTKPCKISSFITKNKDFYDKIRQIQNTCLGQNPMWFALCEQCQVHQNSDRNSET
jgi:hypothetical protein